MHPAIEKLTQSAQLTHTMGQNKPVSPFDLEDLKLPADQIETFIQALSNNTLFTILRLINIDDAHAEIIGQGLRNNKKIGVLSFDNCPPSAIVNNAPQQISMIEFKSVDQPSAAVILDYIHDKKIKKIRISGTSKTVISYILQRIEELECVDDLTLVEVPSDAVEDILKYLTETKKKYNVCLGDKFDGDTLKQMIRQLAQFEHKLSGQTKNKTLVVTEVANLKNPNLREFLNSSQSKKSSTSQQGKPNTDPKVNTPTTPNKNPVPPKVIVQAISLQNGSKDHNDKDNPQQKLVLKVNLPQKRSSSSEIPSPSKEPKVDSNNSKKRENEQPQSERSSKQARVESPNKEHESPKIQGTKTQINHHPDKHKNDSEELKRLRAENKKLQTKIENILKQKDIVETEFKKYQEEAEAEKLEMKIMIDAQLAMYEQQADEINLHGQENYRLCNTMYKLIQKLPVKQITSGQEYADALPSTLTETMTYDTTTKTKIPAPHLSQAPLPPRPKLPPQQMISSIPQHIQLQMLQQHQQVVKNVTMVPTTFFATPAPLTPSKQTSTSPLPPAPGTSPTPTKPANPPARPPAQLRPPTPFPVKDTNAPVKTSIPPTQNGVAPVPQQIQGNTAQGPNGTNSNTVPTITSTMLDPLHLSPEEQEQLDKLFST